MSKLLPVAQYLWNSYTWCTYLKPWPTYITTGRFSVRPDLPSLPHLAGDLVCLCPAFWSHFPLTRLITEISHISSTKFRQLILSKMVKIVATKCHTLTLKCTKFDFGWGSAPDPTGDDHLQHSPRPLGWI